MCSPVEIQVQTNGSVVFSQWYLPTLRDLSQSWQQWTRSASQEQCLVEGDKQTVV